MMLRARDITVHAEGRALVRSASLQLRQGELVTLVGPNGAGKSSLMRALAGVIRHEGEVVLDGINIRQMSARMRAARLAYMPQERSLAWPLKVRDVVALGVPDGLTSTRRADLIDRALHQCRLDELSERRADSLSGGEATRMHCARLMATGAPVWLADEPVAALDPGHQFEFLNLARDFTAEGGSALMVLHDLPLASRFSDRLIVMNAGQIVGEGAPAETLTTRCLAEVFAIAGRFEQARLVIDGPVGAV